MSRGKDGSCVKFRHRLIYKTVGGLAPLILYGFRYKTKRISKTDEPYIVISNHLTEVDMVMAGGTFSQYMKFVAGEHMLRTKNGPWMDWAQGPIYMYKGSISIDTMREIMRVIKSGTNVMIFPEGSRSFNGETMQLDTGIAKLVKMAGCGLVTYRIEGGYFVAPRWAYSSRKGPMKADVVNIYSSEEVAAMSRQELTDHINHDIYENAYETQRKNMYEYKGKNLAEGLDNYLIKCSRCGAFDSMITEGDGFRCKECGQSGIYNTRGFLEGERLRFDNVYDWGVWSENETSDHIRSFEGDGPVFTDSDTLMYEVFSDHSRKDISSGDIKGYKDRIEAGGEVFDFKDISGIDMLYFGKTLVFTYKKRHMFITGEHFHAIKYQKLYEAFRKEK